ncbi:MAG TPA: hypothetical protein DEG70_09110 [Chloroflexi bacterium]|nr:hypothetical protein [Chloroflexota bacterium]
MRDYIVLISPIELVQSITGWLLGGSGSTIGNLVGPAYLVGVVAAVIAAGLIMQRRYLAEE